MRKGKPMRGEISLEAMITAIFVSLFAAWTATSIFAKSGAESCATACGAGRFQKWTERAHDPFVPEQCECVREARQ